jgi:hypothetical protein
MSIVQALPSAKGGRAFLELRNDWTEPVTIKTVVCFPFGSGPGLPLTSTPLSLSVGEARVLDVTDALRRVINAERAECSFKILLTLEPEPPSQPGSDTYAVRHTAGGFELFVSSG